MIACAALLIALVLLPRQARPLPILLGIRVRQAATVSKGVSASGAAPEPRADMPPGADVVARRRLRLVVGPSVLRPDGLHVRMSLVDPGGAVPDVGTPGPPIVLTHGEPVVARMTPPRAGTFIYHAYNPAALHVGDGLVGPLIVMEPGEPFDPSREIVWVVGGRGVDENGFLRLAKHAAPLPAPYRARSPARVRTSVGETYDFEWVPARRGELRLEVRNGGLLMTEQRVQVR